MYTSFCLIMGPFKGKCLFLPDYHPLGHRGACAETPSHLCGPGNTRVSFTTGAVWSAILATAGLLVSCVAWLHRIQYVVALILVLLGLWFFWLYLLITLRRFHVDLGSLWSINRKSHLHTCILSLSKWAGSGCWTVNHLNATSTVFNFDIVEF